MSSMQHFVRFLESVLLRVLRALCPILLLLIAAVKIGQRVKYRAWQTWFESKADFLPPWTFTAFWIALAVIVVLMAILSIRKSLSGNLLVLKTNSGFPLKIREGAISRFVHDRLESLPFIRNSRISARSAGGALEVQGRVWVSCCEKIDDLHNQVCQRIVDDTKRALGITKVMTPKIVFEDMEASAARNGNREASGRVEIFPKPAALEGGEGATVPWRPSADEKKRTDREKPSEEDERKDV
ncbi:hypothetical protein JW916_11085 [Candidatus Sumerlaeota bacterium]|nr:hypothetical protein [Candidatus Sumerlaeota bacterium]